MFVTADQGLRRATAFEVRKNGSTFTVTRNAITDAELGAKFVISHNIFGYNLAKVLGGDDESGTYGVEDYLEAFDAFDVGIFLHCLESGDDSDPLPAMYIDLDFASSSPNILRDFDRLAPLSGHLDFTLPPDILQDRMAIIRARQVAQQPQITSEMTAERVAEHDD
ncbi:uncharacterized protein LY89DRAFT_730814 [Mollisia scopiformis]|uniref:Uncharacterized protein n=1 Tax=Mollisia scopiformis TaxID=149040 RepID=A0A194XL27_MOLSC|nr:uncharacterized protein LY89DRAFT_730814 [Mollisia scopiformis]KUJ20799.1 hypothetical protein LY89DRAFT_730814 [Mollisia scopiformis]